MSGFDFAANTAPHAVEVRLAGEMRFDRRAAWREFVENRHIEITVESERKSARNRRGRQHQDVRRMAVRGGLIHQALALQHAEAMLLVDGHETQLRELHVVFDQSVRADRELCFAVADAFEGGCFFRGLHAADQQLHAIAGVLENAARGKIMLHGENFGWRHQRGLAAVGDGDDRRLQRHNRLAAADVALQQAIHRSAIFRGRRRFRRGRAFGPRWA